MHLLTHELLEPLAAKHLNLSTLVEMALEHAEQRRGEAERLRKLVEEMDSQVVVEKEQKEWLIRQVPWKVLSMRMLYRGTRDGFQRHKFHNLCDKKGPTIVIMKSLAGKIFGGFTT